MKSEKLTLILTITLLAVCAVGIGGFLLMIFVNGWLHDATGLPKIGYFQSCGAFMLLHALVSRATPKTEK